MEDADSIEKMISIYNDFILFFADIQPEKRNVSPKWYMYLGWLRQKRNIISDLDAFLNDCILKWVSRQEECTYDQYIHSLTNLREGINATKIENEILQKSGITKNRDIIILIGKRAEQNQLRLKIESGSKNQELIRKYFHSSKYIAGHGRVFDIAEIELANDNGIKTESLKEEFLKDIAEDKKRAEEKLKKAEEKKKEERKIRIIQIVFFIVCAIVVGFLSSWLDQYINPITIIVLIGLPGALIAFLKKG
jgi:F0F1-type ATP synthase assembly protein I